MNVKKSAKMCCFQTGF